MKYLKQIAYVLLLIGGINWGVYGISGYDVVDVLLGNIPMIANLVYVLVGLSAVYVLLQRYSMCSCTQKCDCTHSTCGCDTKSQIEEKNN